MPSNVARRSAGTPIDPPDVLIAAMVLANDWTLVTRNLKYLARTEALLVNPWDYNASEAGSTT